MDTDGALCEVGNDGSNLDVFFKGLKYVVRDLRNILSMRFIFLTSRREYINIDMFVK